jgi:hypothetical protein
MGDRVVTHKKPPAPLLADLDTLLAEEEVENRIKLVLSPPKDELHARAAREALLNAESNPLFPYLERIEQMARIGLEPGQMAGRLGFTMPAFQAACRDFPENVGAMERGRAGGVEDMASALFQSAMIAGDVSAQKFYLEKKGGFTTPRDRAGPTSNANNEFLTEAAPIDIGRINGAMQRHKALLDETVDGTADEVKK